MLIERLEHFIREAPPVTPPWIALQRNEAGDGLAEIAKIEAHRNQVSGFLEVHWPEAVERFKTHGTRGLEELLAECLSQDDHTRCQT